MEPEANAAPAGASEGLSVDAAVSRLMSMEDNEGTTAATPEAPAEPSTPTATDASAEPTTSSEEPAAAPEEASPEGDEPPVEGESTAEPEPDQYAHGNTRTRLRDGTVTTVGELKKLAEEAREFRARGPELSQRQQALQAEVAQVAQQKQFFAQALPLAIQVLQAQVPPPPSPELMQSDPLAHYEQMDAHNRARGKLAQLQQAQVAAQQQALHEQQANARVEQERFHSYLGEQRSQLHTKIPSLQSEEGAKAAYAGFVETAGKYGFTSEEVNHVYDHRLLHMVHDLTSQNKALKVKADAHDKLLASKPAAEKKAAGAVTPVKAPGNRLTPTEAQSQHRQGLVQKARASGGDHRSVAAILEAFEQ